MIFKLFVYNIFIYTFKFAKSMQPTLNIKKLLPDVILPAYTKLGDCALDLRASGQWVIDLDGEKKETDAESLIIKPGERIGAKTGLAIEIPPGYWGSVRDRSGHALKNGIHTMAGVFDETYRGDWMVVLVNLGKKDYNIKKGERIAQVIIAPYSRCDIQEVSELSDSVRGETGFGHSGKH